MIIDDTEQMEDEQARSEQDITLRDRKEAERQFNSGEQIICTICRRTFKTHHELQRHFRSHGMAFLKSSVKSPQ